MSLYLCIYHGSLFGQFSTFLYYYYDFFYLLCEGHKYETEWLALLILIASCAAAVSAAGAANIFRSYNDSFNTNLVS
jgi:hypothetical protein